MLNCRVPASALAAVLAVVASLITTRAASAQCDLQWQSGGGYPGLSGGAAALAPWDPDGAGPAPAQLIVAGGFQFAGSQQVDSIARFDPATATWHTMVGMDAAVHALATLPNGDIIAGGAFGGAWGTIAANIARWDGAQWHAMGAGLSGVCNSLTVLANGDVVAAGNFQYAGGVLVNHVARWDGSAWHAFGSGMSGGYPEAKFVSALPNGDLIVAGDFSPFGGAGVKDFRRWDGSSWSVMPSIGTQSIRALHTAPSGEVYAGTAGDLWRLNGTWQSFAAVSGTWAEVSSIATAANGTLLVGGRFDVIAGVAADNLARWDGVNWVAEGVGAPTESTCLAELAGGQLFVGGNFSAAAYQSASNIVQWTGSTWSVMGGNGLSHVIVDRTTLLDGTEVLLTDGFPQRLLRVTAAGFVPIDAPMDANMAHVATLKNGDLVVGGTFGMWLNGALHWSIARWDGAVWHGLDTGLHNNGSLPEVMSMLPRANGDLTVVGRFTVPGIASNNENINIASWDGTSWSAITTGFDGVGLTPARPGSLALMTNGDVVVGGKFISVGGVAASNIARWDGSNWSPLGSGIQGNSVTAVNVTALVNGDLIAAGLFHTAGGQSANNIARWNGVSWSPLGSGADGSVSAVLELPGGDLVVGGSFSQAGGLAASCIARWEAGLWTTLGSGVDGGVTSLVRTETGVSVAGQFSKANSVVFPRLTELNTPCPASAHSFGGGCVSGTGVSVLEPEELAYGGSTMCTVGSGFGAGSLAVEVLGFTPIALPLQFIMPQGGGLNCDLLVDPVVMLPLVVPSSGTVVLELALPTTAVLGHQVWQQVIELQLGLTGNIDGLFSSNALHHVIGSF